MPGLVVAAGAADGMPVLTLTAPIPLFCRDIFLASCGLRLRGRARESSGSEWSDSTASEIGSAVDIRPFPFDSFDVMK